MIRNVFVLFTLLALCACQNGPQSRSELKAADVNFVPTKHLADAITLAATLPPKKTLLVYDIDDTLLSTPYLTGSNEQREFFGSDSWYVWQSALKPEDGDKLPNACLYDFLAINYETGTQKATEDDAGITLQSIKVDSLFLTSRNPDYRGGTERELKEAHINLPSPLAGTQGVLVHRKDGTAMSYLRGIYMTKGGDKGTALTALLDQLKVRKKKYSDVVMVDDSWKNIKAMANEMDKRGVRFHGFLYTGIKEDPTAGDAIPPAVTGRHPNAEEAWKSWETWFTALESSYPGRAERLRKQGCPTKAPVEVGL